MTAPPPKPPHTAVPVSKRTLWTIIIVGAAGVILGVWLVAAWLPRLFNEPETGPGQTTGTGTTDERRIQATLYYASADGEALVPVSRQVAYGETPAEQARRIIDAQLAAPPDGQTSVIPAGTALRHVFLAGTGEMYLDFGPEIARAHPGGSLAETLTVFALVNAVTVNLPDVTAVQILVDGREVDTLAGHLDLRQPLQKSLKWVRKQ